jgi:hypothetical protein
LTPVQFGNAAEQLFGLALGLTGAVLLDCAKAVPAIDIAANKAKTGNFMIILQNGWRLTGTDRLQRRGADGVPERDRRGAICARESE